MVNMHLGRIATLTFGLFRAWGSNCPLNFLDVATGEPTEQLT